MIYVYTREKLLDLLTKFYRYIYFRQ